MVDLAIVITVIGLAAVIVIFARRIKRWIDGRLLKENGEPIPIFNCKIASRGDGSNKPDSGDVYDCTEAGEGLEETKPR